MKTTVNFSNFYDAFQRMGRGEQFSYNGLTALFDYLEQLEEDTGDEIELDVIALCCGYSEGLLDEVLKDYSLESLDELHDRTLVVNYDEETGRVLYQQF